MHGLNRTDGVWIVILPIAWFDRFHSPNVHSLLMLVDDFRKGVLRMGESKGAIDED